MSRVCQKIHKQEDLLQTLNENINASQHQVDLLLDLSQMVSDPSYKCCPSSKRAKENLDR